MGNYIFQDITHASLYEPRIELIKKQLESLLSVVELEGGGEVIKVDAFQLKDLNDWLVPSTCDPIEILGYAGARCNADCTFCCNKGNPPSVALHPLRRSAAEEFEEIKTRVKYFSPQAEVALFPALGDIYEVLAHPRILEVLQLLRPKTSKPFRLTTNAATLTPEMIALLAELRPLYIYLSLNTASLRRRQKLMQDSRAEVALGALPLLREKAIAYAVVIVAWPLGSVGELLQDIAHTVAYADGFDPHLIEVHLPGYSKYFSSQKLFDQEEVWQAVVGCVRNLREKTLAPIVVMPTMYEENLYEPHCNLPKLIGVIKNSPAARAGLQREDLILEINDLPVSSRPQARDLLSAVVRAGCGEARIKVKRDGKTRDLALNPQSFSYPYSRDSDSHLGIIMMGAGLRPGYVEDLQELADRHRAKRVLFLSSTLVKPSFEQELVKSLLFAGGDLRIEIEVPRNNFFGGNIFMGDLLVVQDFIDHIKEYVKRRGGPDLVVIPSSPFNLGGWRRDLTGRVYLDIEREVGIAVELLDCATIYD